MKAFISSMLLAAAAVAPTTAAVAQTTATHPWVRGTVAQQKATGLFVELTSAQGGRLVSASSPMATAVELHQMAMDGNVMTMRALPDGLPLPAGKPVALTPGGHHLMLMGLTQPLKAGDTVTVMLVIESADRQRETLEIKAPVRALGAAPAEHKH